MPKAKKATDGTESCKNSVCSPNGPAIHFPFRIQSRQPESCGYPGFDLSCNNATQTVLLNLPYSGQFIVQGIDYTTQQIWINDPKNCLPKQLLSLNLSGSPFKGVYHQEFSFFNCSSVLLKDQLTPIICLSDSNHTIFATSSRRVAALLLSTCEFITNVSVPVQWPFYEQILSSDLNDDLWLTWDEPSGCGKCESRGGQCGFKTNSSHEIVCSNVPHQSGFTWSARYAITIGVGVPGSMCLLGLLCFLFGKIESYNARRHVEIPEFNPTIAPPPKIMGIGAAQTEQGSGELSLKEGPIKAQSRDINEVMVMPDSLQGSRSELLPNTAGQRTESESKSLFSEGVFNTSESDDAASTEGGRNEMVQETIATVQTDVTTVMEIELCGIDSSLMPTLSSKLAVVLNSTTTIGSPKSQPIINESSLFNASLISVVEVKRDTLVAKISDIEAALITHDNSPFLLL
nr:putative ring-h2 finger protein atl21b [Quercus suber]